MERLAAELGGGKAPNPMIRKNVSRRYPARDGCLQRTSDWPCNGNEPLR